MNLPGLIVSLLVDSCLIPKNAPVVGSQLRSKSYLSTFNFYVPKDMLNPARIFDLALKTALVSIAVDG